MVLFMPPVAMSSDKHSTSPRHSHSSASTTSADVSCTVSVGAVVRSPLTSTQPSLVSVTHPQSSHAPLTSVVDHVVADDEASASLSVTFEDKSLWRDSFSILYEFYRTGTFCDVEIHVGSQQINCHRLVLACFSQYFR